MKIFGTILPFIGRVCGPCDSDGLPAIDDTGAAAADFEVKSFCLAWLGQVLLIPYSDVMARAVDPANPRRYLAGNL
jgi:hypothetical protein